MRGISILKLINVKTLSRLLYKINFVKECLNTFVIIIIFLNIKIVVTLYSLMPISMSVCLIALPLRNVLFLFYIVYPFAICIFINFVKTLSNVSYRVKIKFSSVFRYCHFPVCMSSE